MTNGTGFRNRISTEARLRQTKNIGAIVDDLVTMSNEYHRVTGCLRKICFPHPRVVNLRYEEKNLSNSFALACVVLRSLHPKVRYGPFCR